jgi:hypothetical protein
MMVFPFHSLDFDVTPDNHIWAKITISRDLYNVFQNNITFKYFDFLSVRGYPNVIVLSIKIPEGIEVCWELQSSLCQFLIDKYGDQPNCHVELLRKWIKLTTHQKEIL